MSTITVLTLVPNARDKLARCLQSVQWADEIFCVVDPKTADGSEEIARQYATRVVVHEYINKAAQCSWAIPQITTEWVLILDADEWVSEALACRIRTTISQPGGANGYEVKRLSYFFGKLIKGCGWQRDYNLRLFRKDKGKYLDRRVHSRIVVDGKVGVIHEPMYHDTYRDFDEYFSTFQRFTTWGAQDLFDQGKRTNVLDLTARPLLRFCKMYFLHRGFQDGLHGAVLCGLGAFSVFMKYAKLWDLQRRHSSRQTDKIE